MMVAVLVAAIAVLAAPSRSANAASRIYDAQTITRADVEEINAAGARHPLLSHASAWSVSPHEEARGAGTTFLTRSVATEAAGVGPVNVVGGSHNCVSCAIAGDSALAGNPASALNLYPGVPIPGGNAAIEAYAGAPWRAVAGQGAIESELLEAGNRAGGIVYGTNGRTAHVWNAIVQDGNVNFVDFQGIGPSGPAAFDGWTKFAFVRTG